MLKEADLRIGFTNLFKSPTSHEILPRDTLQVRLLLCLYGLGTNAGIKRVASGAQINYRDLLGNIKQTGLKLHIKYSQPATIVR